MARPDIVTGKNSSFQLTLQNKQTQKTFDFIYYAYDDDDYLI